MTDAEAAEHDEATRALDPFYDPGKWTSQRTIHRGSGPPIVVSLERVGLGCNFGGWGKRGAFGYHVRSRVGTRPLPSCFVWFHHRPWRGRRGMWTWVQSEAVPCFKTITRPLAPGTPLWSTMRSAADHAALCMARDHGGRR